MRRILVAPLLLCAACGPAVASVLLDAGPEEATA